MTSAPRILIIGVDILKVNSQLARHMMKVFLEGSSDTEPTLYLRRSLGVSRA